MNVSIIIVNHNGKKWLKDCLDTVFLQTYKPYEVIFVDNASTDKSVDFVKKNYPKVKIIRSKVNLGFGKGNNLGVEKARGPIVFLLNNDTKLNKNTVKKLVDFKLKNSLNIVGPKLLDYEGRDIHSGKHLTVDYTGYLGYGEKSFFIDGCALMIDKKDFETIGGFDKKYFLYSEEIDLCWRAYLYGMKVDKCSETYIQHFCGGTAGSTQRPVWGKHIVKLFRRYEVEKNNLRTVIKNYKLVNLLWVIPLFIMESFFESLVYLLTGNIKAWWVIIKAYCWNLVNFPDTLKQRKIVQKKRIISDWEIIKIMSFRLNKLRAFITIGIPEFRE